MCAMACRGHPTWVQPLLAGNRQRPTWVRPHTRGLRNVVPPPLPTYKQKAPTARGAEPVGRWPGKAEAEPPPRCRRRGVGPYAKGASVTTTALPSIPSIVNHSIPLHCHPFHALHTIASSPSTAQHSTTLIRMPIAPRPRQPPSAILFQVIPQVPEASRRHRYRLSAEQTQCESPIVASDVSLSESTSSCHSSQPFC